MRESIKRFIACGLSAVVIAAPLNIYAASISEAPMAAAPLSKAEAEVSQSMAVSILPETVAKPEADSKINIQYHTPGEIKAFVEAHPVSFLPADYTTEPSAASKEPGVLKDSVLNDALNAINICRYIAGLSYNVTIGKEEQEKAQAGAFVNYVNGKMSHTPDVPKGWSSEDAVYKLGYSGASSSNLGAGYYTIARAVFDGWMYDGNSSNIDRVGHRRWILNPYMQTTGFGQAGSYTSMYAFGYDNMAFWGYGNAETEKKVSVWPAPNMPVEYFTSTYPWSYSTGETESGDVKVSLKKTSTGKTWNFSASKADGDFYVQNSNYGIKGCVIFRPKDITILAGDTYEVSIAGLSKGDVKYTVNFFSLDSVEATVPDSDFDPTKDNYQGWYIEKGVSYWYENGIRQGDKNDKKNFSYDGSVRGREIYDPASDGWYWLDVINGGAKAVNKEVFMPYIFQDEADHLNDDAWIKSAASGANRKSPDIVDLSGQVEKAIKSHGGNGAGKWVRYDKSGKMIKGWYTVSGADNQLYPDQIGNTYYYDQQTGLMAKGLVTINGVQYYFDETTGKKLR